MMRKVRTDINIKNKLAPFKKTVALLLCAVFALASLSGCFNNEEKISSLSFETYGATAIEKLTAKEGEEIELPVPEWPHYSFEGWFYDSGFLADVKLPFFMPASDTTLYARFAPLTGYVIRFLDTDSSTLLPELAAEAGEIINEPESPSKDGYKFKGWYTESGNPYQFSTMPPYSLNLFAKWEADSNIVPVNFYGNNRLITTKYIEIGDTVSASGVIDEAEFLLIGNWVDGSASIYDFNTPIPQAEKLDLHIKYRTKALRIESGVLLEYTGSAESVIVLDDTVSSIGANVFKGKTRLTSVYLDGVVREIGDSAFSGCTALDSVYGLENVEVIGADAFLKCSKLTLAELDSAISIGNSAFSGCSMLANVVFGEALETIGERAFINCKALKSPVFYSGLIEIGEYAFQNCLSIREFRVPANVIMGEGVLDGCTSLGVFGILENSGDRLNKGDDGNIYADGGKALVFYNGAGSSFEVPEGITSIERTAFLASDSLKSLSLPKSLTKDGSFGILNQCTNLTSLSISSFDKIPYLAHLYGAENGKQNGVISAFVPTNLKTINITDASIEVIPDYAFYGCTGLDAVNGIDNVKTIGAYAFAYTTFLSVFNVGKNLRSVSNGAFAGSTLTGFIIDSANTHFTTGVLSYLYNKTDKLLVKAVSSEDVIDFSSMEFEGITGIADFAFENYTALETLEIPDTVSFVGDSAFLGCNNLKELTLPIDGILSADRSFTNILGGSAITLDILRLINGREIPSYSFNASKVKNIVLDSLVEVIAPYAFYESTELVSVSGLSNVRTIGEAAFYNCDKLSNIVLGNEIELIDDFAFYGAGLTKLTIPKSLETIGSYAFAYTSIAVIEFYGGATASSLKNIYGAAFAFSGGISGELILPASLEYLGSAFSRTNITSLSFAGSKSSELVLGDNAFMNCASLVSADFSNTNLTEIGSAGLSYCVELIEVILPDTLTKIASFAFIECIKLENVDIPASVRSVGQRILDQTDWAKNQPAGIMYKDHVAVGYKGLINTPDIVFESEVDGTEITIICSRVFWSTGFQGDEHIPFSYENVKSITIPYSYKIISENAFESAENLETLIIGSGVEIIGSLAFSGCLSLKTVQIGNDAEGSALKEIEQFAFVFCNELSSFVLHKNILSALDAPMLNKTSDGVLTIFAKQVEWASKDGTYYYVPTEFNIINISVPSASNEYYLEAWADLLSDYIELTAI